jgi:hypothetical protein
MELNDIGIHGSTDVQMKPLSVISGSEARKKLVRDLLEDISMTDLISILEEIQEEFMILEHERYTDDCDYSIEIKDRLGYTDKINFAAIISKHIH